MPTKTKLLSAAEIELMLIKAVKNRNDEFKAELPQLMKPMIDTALDSAIAATGKKLGVDVNSIESLDSHHRQREYVKRKMVLEEDFKRTVFNTVAKFSLAGIMGWLASKIFGGY